MAAQVSGDVAKAGQGSKVLLLLNGAGEEAFAPAVTAERRAPTATLPVIITGVHAELGSGVVRRGSPAATHNGRFAENFNPAAGSGRGGKGYVVVSEPVKKS